MNVVVVILDCVGSGGSGDDARGLDYFDDDGVGDDGGGDNFDYDGGGDAGDDKGNGGYDDDNGGGVDGNDSNDDDDEQNESARDIVVKGRTKTDSNIKMEKISEESKKKREK